MIQIKNLTFSYNPREDRIFFLINHDDFNNRIDFIVTRKKLIELLNGFDDILINYCDNGKLFKELYQNQEPLINTQEPKKNNKLNQKDKNNNLNHNKWEKNVNTKELILTQNKKPIILDAISYTNKDNKLVFKYISNNKVYAVSTMDSVIFQQTLSSMMRIIPFVSWGISPHILA